MSKINYVLLVLLLIFCSCKNKDAKKSAASPQEIGTLLQDRYKDILDYKIDPGAFPRSEDSLGNIKKTRSGSWTSGFFPGNLWELYQLTGKEAYKNKAEEWTALVEKEKNNGRSHDVGFKVFNSFGNGLEVEPNNEHYKKVIVQAAKTLAGRFDPTVGAIRSWDFNADKWQFPVIIDNMMNLELLFEATKISHDSSYYKIAVQHANKTLKNHFRKDNSTYHVVVYDTVSGKPYKKVTHQGYSDSSSWSRGQAWAVYGFTMAYRYTKKKAYLDQAKATAKFFIDHKNLPEDGIPYWDFDDPKIPNAPRDVSAATTMASALYELYGYTQDNAFLNYSNKVIKSLKSKKYILPKSNTAPFILTSSTGNYPKNDEVDCPIVYGDYYFLEALLRQEDLKK